MNKERLQLLEQARNIELNMCDLYKLYESNYQEDKDFWSQMAKEETHHAAMLELAEDFFENFPEEIVYRNLEDLKKGNQVIKDTIEQYKQTPPSKQEAYQKAIDLENGAYEIHYQKILSQNPNSDKMKLFQKLNEDDKDHANRITELLNKK